MSTGNNTEYAGSYVYENGSLQFFGTPEGYVEPNTTGGYDYIYQYTDHLGNIRVSYKNTGTASNPSLEIQEENNYYPFGLKHKGYNYNQNGRDHKYGFGGKEEQDDDVAGTQLDWLDFGARNYDASLGRWMNIDPHADKYYGINPYNYAINNPVLLIDPDGKDAIVTIKDGVITVTTNIYIYGSGATQSKARRIKNSIDRFWSSKNHKYTDENGKEYKVEFNTNVELYEGEEENDPTIIPESWDPSNTDNFIEVVKGKGRSFVKGGDEGKWYTKGQTEGIYSSTEEDETYGHEFDHLLGLDDRYRGRVARFFGADRYEEGYENQIMGGGTQVDQKAVDGVVRESVKKYNKFVDKYGNKEATKNTYTTKIDKRNANN